MGLCDREAERGEKKFFFHTGVDKEKVIHEILSGLNDDDDDTHQGRGRRS